MMTKIFWITLGGVVASVVVLGLQRKTLTGLREQVTQARAEVQAMESPGWNPSETSAKVGTKVGKRTLKTPLLVASAEKVKVTKIQLELLLERMGDITESPMESMSMLQEILEVVQDLNIDEMIALAKELGNENDAGDRANFTKMILIMLAAEYQPERVLNDTALLGEMPLRMAALGALARKDPKAAIRWFETEEMQDHERRQLAIGIAANLFQSDLVAGLEFLRNLPSTDREAAMHGLTGMGGLAMMLTDPARQEALFKAVEREEDMEFRKQFGKSLVTMTMVRGDVEEAKAMLDRLSLSDDDRLEVVIGLSYGAVNSAPGEIISWITEESEGQKREEAVASAVRGWARQDYNAAGEWLGIQEPGSVTDAAIASFAKTVMQIEPTTALTWVGEITDPKIQENTTRAVLSHWAGTDREAAEAWLTERELSVDKWLN